MLFSSTYATLIKTTILKFGEKIKAPVGKITNLRGSLLPSDGLNFIYPYGVGAYPADKGMAVVMPVNGGNKEYLIIGFTQPLPTQIASNDDIYEIKKGEAWLNSGRYMLLAQNDGLRGYRFDSKFNTTLSNGEAFVAMMLNRIKELESMISTINKNYETLKNTFNSHTHGGVQSGGASTKSPDSQLSQTNIDNFNTLTHDQQYLEDGKALINDKGEVYK